MLRKLMIMAFVSGSMSVGACNTVKGAGEDIKSVAECTEEMMKRGDC